MIVYKCMLSVDWLFLDMNAYFASVEQQLQPELRGRPVAVVPVMTDRTCCIAASYEARPYGVRTGTNVGEARRRCPQLRIVEAGHERYIRVHNQIVAAVETVLPVEKVCSIDEMVCKLSLHQRGVADAVEVGKAVKAAIADQVGQHLRCSVGTGDQYLPGQGGNQSAEARRAGDHHRSRFATEVVSAEAGRLSGHRSADA